MVTFCQKKMRSGNRDVPFLVRPVALILLGAYGVASIFISTSACDLTLVLGAAVRAV
jgi:hypothetical protein